MQGKETSLCRLSCILKAHKLLIYSFVPPLFWACAITMHMTCWSHLMKLSGNEFRQSHDRRRRNHHTTLNYNHSLVILLSSKDFVLFFYLVNVKKNQGGFGPKGTKQHVTTCNRLDWNLRNMHRAFYDNNICRNTSFITTKTWHQCSV